MESSGLRDVWCQQWCQTRQCLIPVSFNVYLDNLLVTLKQSGYGARIGGKYVGCIAYPDDVTVISPTWYAVQKMLDVCTEFAQENGYSSVLASTVSTVKMTVGRGKRRLERGKQH